MDNSEKTILSLFDFSGIWSSFYKNNGYKVNNIVCHNCTDTAVAGAKHFAAKDADGRTQKSIEIFNKTLEIIKYCEPKFWTLEQPVSRLVTLIPEFKQYFKGYFQPYHYGDPYSKKTALFGEFNFPEPTNIVQPKGMRPGQPPEWFSRVGGKSEKTKEYRSKTSEKFAEAFYENNK